MNSTHCESPIRIAAAVIIDADGRLLLVRKRGTSAFMQPGGKIEPDELPINALVRELREELGLVIDPGAPSWLGSFRRRPPMSLASSSMRNCSQYPFRANRYRPPKSRR
ncbi:NUDIX hydrolase [Mesorhizobium shangrilense]|uniref:NUDIX domain-containing protein n=1 Tax=Mesorhizobium shangrilense TaxID=460060 RepID=A0ABV2DAQ0_9HYPH